MSAPLPQMSSQLPLSSICLTHKPAARITYTFIPAKTSSVTNQSLSPSASPPLLVFLAGLGLPAASFHPTIALLSSLDAHPALFTYDRYGHGTSTDRDPLDANAEDPKHGHTVADVVHDLHQLIDAVCIAQNLHPEGKVPPIMFIANSIGCAIARLYAETFPNTVKGLLLLDSVIANTDFVSIHPDPDRLGANEETLPEGVTADGLRQARKIMRMVFHPDQGSAEGLSRKNLSTLLPSSDGPKLIWDEGQTELGPWVTVVGHGWDKFADDSLKGMGVPIAITNHYGNPFWQAYNNDLINITSKERARGPILAEKAGHFVQKDDPLFVVEEVKEML